MISTKKSLEIANVCYANVAGEFALFTNPKYRGANFTWEWFIDHCERMAQSWMLIHGVKGDTEETAKKYAREIAENLVDKATK